MLSEAGGATGVPLRRPAAAHGSVPGSNLLQSGMDAGFQCAVCGEWNETSVDESSGSVQSYVEDCQVCCRPNLLRVSYHPETQEFLIAAELE
jgi:hypothetical protein